MNWKKNLRGHWGLFSMDRVMKDSGIEWIGEIPKEWYVIKNKYLLKDMYSGGTPTSTNQDFYIEDGVPFISISDMSNNDYVENTKKTISESAIAEKNLKILPEGTILYSIYATVGAISELRIKATISQAILALSLNNKVDKAFYKYNLYSMRDFIFSNANGNTQFNLNAGTVNNFFFVYPPLETQFIISNFLDYRCKLIDKSIENQKQLVEKLKSYKQSIITEAVTKGLDPNVQFKDSGIEWIGKIPLEWTVKKLKFIIEAPLQYGANSSGVDYEEMLPRYIRITDITGDNYLKNTGMLSLNEGEAQPYILKDKDLLFARSGGTVGKTFLYRYAYGLSAFAGYLIKASISKNYDAEFIYYYTLSSAYNEWKNQIFIQSTIQNIGADKYSNMKIALPNDLKEQKRIVNFLDEKCKEIDNTINTNERIINKLEQYKKSLIYECVTGKREVK